MSDLTAIELAAVRRQRGTRARWLISLALVLFVAGSIVWNCSGLSFPIWNARGKLERRLERDLGFTLPEGVTVELGSRVAYLDPAEGYLLRVPANEDVESLVRSLREAARTRANGADVQDNPRVIGLGPIPKWFRPQDLPGVRALEIRLGSLGREYGYIVYFAPGRNEVYVLWYTT